MFIWLWSPLLVALFLFNIDFVAIILLRIFIERRFYLARWWTHRYGDTIFLPLYGFCAAIIIQNNLEKLSLSQNTYWQIGCLIVGIVLMLISEYLHIKKGVYTIRQEFAASQLYHSVIFGFMFYLVVSILPDILIIHSPFWAFLGIIVALIGFGITIIGDNLFVNQEPESRK